MLKPGLVAFGDLKYGDRFYCPENDEQMMKVDFSPLFNPGFSFNRPIAVSLKTGKLEWFYPDVIVRRMPAENDCSACIESSKEDL